MEQKVKALFAWTEEGHDTAVHIAGLYRQGGMEVFLHGVAEAEELIAIGEKHGMTHVLYFLDREKLKLVSLADEMGGFTVDVLVEDLILPR